MKLSHINETNDWFKVLQTTDRCQTAMMTLKPGNATGAKPEAHEKSDQVLLMLEGELSGEVGTDRPELKKGDVIIIPAGTRHRFVNRSTGAAVTFNVYSPPAYRRHADSADSD